MHSYGIFRKSPLEVDDINVRCSQEALNAFAKKFPDSPRVDCLQGIMLEVRESPSTALEFYNVLLKADSTNAVRMTD